MKTMAEHVQVVLDWEALNGQRLVGTLYREQAPPAYDLNPNPLRGPHALLLDEVQDDGDLQTVMASHRSFGLTRQQAEQAHERVVSAVRGWRRVAADAGLTRREVEQMASAFLVDA